jgi:hypothetical protein
MANLVDEKFFSELIWLKTEVLYRFRQINDIIQTNYNEDNDPRTIYDAVVKLAYKGWLYERFDEFERRLRRAIVSTHQGCVPHSALYREQHKETKRRLAEALRSDCSTRQTTR